MTVVEDQVEVVSGRLEGVRVSADGFTHTNDGIKAAIDRLFGLGHDGIEVVSIT